MGCKESDTTEGLTHTYVYIFINAYARASQEALAPKNLPANAGDVKYVGLIPMDCSLPGPSVHGTLQAEILEWVAISFSYISLHILYI